MSLIVKNVYKKFGNQQVLSNLNLEVVDGEVVALVGPSGVGKSVLLKIALGLFDADSGEVLINNKNIISAKTEFEKNEIRKDIGVLFQSAALLDYFTVYENIAFTLSQKGKFSEKIIKEKVLNILAELDLLDFINKLPQEIPMGIRKCVGIARALVIEPKIFLFDEPNTGLDPIAGQMVYDLIAKCRKKWKFTGLVISHEIPEVFQVVDRVALLFNGNIAFNSSCENFINSHEELVQQFLLGKTDGPIQIN